MGVVFVCVLPGAPWCEWYWLVGFCFLPGCVRINITFRYVTVVCSGHEIIMFFLLLCRLKPACLHVLANLIGTCIHCRSEPASGIK